MLTIDIPAEHVAQMREEARWAEEGDVEEGRLEAAQEAHRLVQWLDTDDAVRVEIEPKLAWQVAHTALMHYGGRLEDLAGYVTREAAVECRRIADAAHWFAVLNERAYAALADGVLGEAEALTSQRD